MNELSTPLKAARIRVRVKVPIFVRGEKQEYEPEMVTFSGLDDDLEHLALVFGVLGQAPMVRVHSECLTGDVFGSARCDCGSQLEEAVELFGRKGGILLYLRQEGRGIGLYNKLDAYHLQVSHGLDTFSANRALNFPDDLRDFGVAAQMLKALGAHDIVLLTNNPDKIDQLTRYGVGIKQVVRTGLFVNGINRDYLRAKIVQHHHSINLQED